MSVRPARALTVLALGALPAMAGAQRTEYAPGITRYRVTTTTRGTQASPMGSQEFEVGIQQRLTVNLARRAKDTLQATVTLDSLTFRSSQGAPDVSSLAGSRFSSLLSPTGRLYSSGPVPGTHPLLPQLAESVSRLLPSYRGEMAKGTTWSDTTQGKVMQQGLEVDRTVIATYLVAGDTTVEGQRAWKVTRSTTARAAGSGSTQGTAVTLESATTSEASFFLTPAGVYLGGTSDDDVTVRITIVAQNAEISIRQKAQTRVEPVR